MTCLRGSASVSCLRLPGLEGSKEDQVRVEIWMSEERRLFMYKCIAADTVQLLGVVRRAALFHEEQYYTLWKVRYPMARAALNSFWTCPG